MVHLLGWISGWFIVGHLLRLAVDEVKSRRAAKAGREPRP